MTFRIVIAGESQCEIYAQVCLVANYLSQNLPNFCYELIEKTVLEWQTWLSKINCKNKWHHCASPMIWKELLMKGSKPHYIGGASEFLEYCHSYYKFDSFINLKQLSTLTDNNVQFRKKIQRYTEKEKENIIYRETTEKNNFTICISGATNPFAMNIVSGLLEMSTAAKNISKIYLFDQCTETAQMEFLEYDCGYVGTNNSSKVVKYVPKLGIALTNSDLLIILDHVPFEDDSTLGDWLKGNRTLMKSIADTINASGSPDLRILLPNLGPSCYNATVLTKLLKTINEKNVAVATSDLGLEIIPQIAEIAKIPAKNIYCPPVWGFVGINHLVDVRTTIHRYDSFYPYERYKKVNNSTLKIGTLRPEIRTLEYLLHNDETLWLKVSGRKTKINEQNIVPMNKVVAVLNIVKLWLFGTQSNDIVNLGILCNGSFGLNFAGIFSQPAQYVDGFWKPAYDFLLPRDPQVKINYLEFIANMTLQLRKGALPKVDTHYPPYRKPRLIKNFIKKHDLRFLE